jgi:hypothetical protein
MPLVAKDRQDFYKARICALLSVDHRATHVQLLEKLKAEGITYARVSRVSSKSLTGR